MNPKRIVLAANGGWSSQSAKDRLGLLKRRAPWPFAVVSAGSLPTPEQIEGILDHASMDAVLVLQRVLPPPPAMRQIRAAFPKIIFDFDDAIYASASRMHRLAPVERLKAVARFVARGSTTASRRRKPLIETLRHVDICTAGNSILAAFATPHARRVAIIPTTAEPVERPPLTRPSRPTLVWLGLPVNLRYLALVKPALLRLQAELDFAVKIVSAEPWNDPDVSSEWIPYSEDAERAAMLDATVGLAPLTDDPWTRGKCARRSIQYGGHALPTVASPVGITEEVVLHGRTGYLGRSEDDWVWALRRLLTDSELVDALGAVALDHVKRHYSHEVAARLWIDAIRSL